MKDNHHNMAPWDEGIYQTGAVTIPRQREGLLMVLLVIAVLLGGVVTFLGLLNVRLFAVLKQQEKNALQIQEADADPGAPVTTDLSPEFEMVLSPIPQEQPSPQEIYAECTDTMVSICCGDSEITGVVMHSSGYIVTSRSAVVTGDGVTVRLPNRQEYTATVVGSDVMTDLAVLYISAGELTPAMFGDSDGLRIGDTVCAIQGQGMLANGTVRAIEQGEVPSIDTDALRSFGEPLLDSYGRVVGIYTAWGDQIRVVPSTTVKHIVEQLVHQGYVSGRPGLGIDCTPISQQHQCYYDLPAGLYVSRADADGPLETGDILLAVNGSPVSDNETFNALLSDYQVGDKVLLTILRGEEKMVLGASIVPTP